MEYPADHFPAGLRVLVVDDDPICLLILERLLRSCLYQVTTCGEAVIALSMLRENRSRFDVVISDVHMPNMDGFKLLELVNLEMDVPVIMMSANGETSNVMKGILEGACDYLLKPVRIEELQNIWQHVVRKKQRTRKDSEHADNLRDCQRPKQIQTDGVATVLPPDEENAFCSSLKRKESKDDDSDIEEEDSLGTVKRQRVVWSVELHQKFVGAVNQLGLEQAVPKRILDLMNVPGLTRENVASHLQKFRLYLKRMSGSVNQQASLASCIGTTGTYSKSLAWMNGLSSSPAVGELSLQVFENPQSRTEARPDTFDGGGMGCNDSTSVIQLMAEPYMDYRELLMPQYHRSHGSVQPVIPGPANMSRLEFIRSQSSQTNTLPQNSSELVQQHFRIPGSRQLVFNGGLNFREETPASASLLSMHQFQLAQLQSNRTNNFPLSHGLAEWQRGLEYITTVDCMNNVLGSNGLFSDCSPKDDCFPSKAVYGDCKDIPSACLPAPNRTSVLNVHLLEGTPAILDPKAAGKDQAKETMNSMMLSSSGMEYASSIHSSPRRDCVIAPRQPDFR